MLLCLWEEAAGEEGKSEEKATEAQIQVGRYVCIYEQQSKEGTQLWENELNKKRVDTCYTTANWISLYLFVL